MWKAEKVKIRLFGHFRPKSGLFRQKEDQFGSIFSKRDAIRPRSDKADLLGSTDIGANNFDTNTISVASYLSEGNLAVFLLQERVCMNNPWHKHNKSPNS